MGVDVYHGAWTSTHNGYNVLKLLKLSFWSWVCGSNCTGRTHLPLRVKIFFSTDVWFMILKRSVSDKQKQRTKIFNDPSDGYGAIHENVPKLRNCAKRCNFGTFS